MSKLTINFQPFYNAIGKALEISLEEFIQEEIIPVTPKDKGKLRESIKLKKVNNFHYIIYCEDTTDYGKYVHEMPNDITNWTTAGTGNKFIERPVYSKNTVIWNKMRTKLSLSMKGNVSVSNTHSNALNMYSGVM